MKTLIEVWALTFLVFLRGRFGVRYLTWGMVGNGCLLLFVFPALLAFLCLSIALLAQGALGRLVTSESMLRLFLIVWGFVPYTVFFHWYLVLAIYRRLQIQKRVRNGSGEYTRSIATPAEFWLRCRIGRLCRDTTDVERILEPAATIGLGLILTFLANWFGLYLLIGGVCLHFTARRDFVDTRETIHDIRDGVAYAEYVTEEASIGECDSPEPVFTPSLAGAKLPDNSLPTIAEAFSALPQELREFIRPVRPATSQKNGGKQ